MGEGQTSIMDKALLGTTERNFARGQIVVRHETVRMTDVVSDGLSAPTGTLKPGGNAPPELGDNAGARACSPGQGLPFCGGAKKLRSSFCFLGEPQTRRVSVSGRTKQKPAVPPARRRLSHLAVPARKRCQKR